MAWGSEKSGVRYKAVGVSPEFHKTVRRLAATDPKGRKMYEILDDIVLPILKRQLAKQNERATNG